ncbi:unnamed protein product [Parascedosporium putredinis]|uniref:Uncharacterized protein n=1 Tax=Parascedosporium putredinis TaxID=1442378 RepID=A0A9P1H7V7_9PEZI|nr:unnamed protein product [Parascedosporium putredinis]CAI8001555.1 unnamed protein product [Parascedosporium putredinis]
MAVINSIHKFNPTTPSTTLPPNQTYPHHSPSPRRTPALSTPAPLTAPSAITTALSSAPNPAHRFTAHPTSCSKNPLPSTSRKTWPEISWPPPTGPRRLTRHRREKLTRIRPPFLHFALDHLARPARQPEPRSMSAGPKNHCVTRIHQSVVTPYRANACARRLPAPSAGIGGFREPGARRAKS